MPSSRRADLPHAEGRGRCARTEFACTGEAVFGSAAGALAGELEKAIALPVRLKDAALVADELSACPASSLSVSRRFALAKGEGGGAGGKPAFDRRA
jgi:hypothetical protein